MSLAGILSRPQPLAAHHDLSAFDCGAAALNEWLTRRARANQASGASQTFVVCQESVVVAYYCLASGAVALREAPGRLRRNMPDPIPAVVLGRLAVSLSHHGHGLGRALLHDASARTLQAAELIGVRALLVHAVDEGAKRFYLRHGFSELFSGGLTLYALLADLREELQ